MMPDRDKKRAVIRSILELQPNATAREIERDGRWRRSYGKPHAQMIESVKGLVRAKSVINGVPTEGRLGLYQFVEALLGGQPTVNRDEATARVERYFGNDTFKRSSIREAYYNRRTFLRSHMSNHDALLEIDKTAKCWCVNFNFDDCLKHGIDNNLWMMQYQYGDGHGQTLQDDKKGAIQRNWSQAERIEEGDWFVAYLKPKRFFAVGKVRRPRTIGQGPTGEIQEYIKQKKSPVHPTGHIYYTSVFYEDFTDSWRKAGHNGFRYPQRIDVEQWLHYAPAGVSVKGLGETRLYDLQNAVFEIPKAFFQTVLAKLSSASGTPMRVPSPTEISELRSDQAIEVLEKDHAKSQGFVLDSSLRKALERYAMDAAKERFRSKGYAVHDRSANRPYDLECELGNVVVYVEVKGTQTAGDAVFLTAGEVKFAREHKAQMILYLVHSIEVSADGSLSGGKQVLVEPWNLEEGHLRPISYQYIVGRSRNDA
jgi:Domain of unknown function (DUF3883)